MSKNKNPSTETTVHGARTLSSRQVDASKQINPKHHQQQAVVVDRTTPMESARAFHKAWPELYRLDNKFYARPRTHPYSDVEVEGSAWRFLENAIDPLGRPFTPRLKDVKEVLSALKAVIDEPDGAQP